MHKFKKKIIYYKSRTQFAINSWNKKCQNALKRSISTDLFVIIEIYMKFNLYSIMMNFVERR